jgi:hypothetical protein
MMITSIGISTIPHLITINPDSQLVGADSEDYSLLLESLSDNGSTFLISSEKILEQFKEDRPLSLLIYFFFSKSLSFLNSAAALDLLPLILGPILVLVYYFLTKELTSNDSTALLASFLTIVSFQSLVGIYSGFYANWLSLIFGNLSLVFVFKYFKSSSILNCCIFSLLMVLTLLTHSSNWSILFFVIIIFLAILLVFKREEKKKIIFLYLALVPSGLIDLAKLILLNFSGLIGDVSFAQDKIMLSPEILNVWHNLVVTHNINLGGILGNSLILLLVLYWVYVSKLKEKATILIILFLSLSILPIIFADTDVQSRILFEIPFQIPAAIGLYHIKARYGNALFICTCLWLLVISVRIVSNFHFDVYEY